MSPFNQYRATKTYIFYAPGCTRGGAGTWFKKAYCTEDEAWEGARETERKVKPNPGHSLHAYKCRFGDHYHVGHVKHLPSFFDDDNSWTLVASLRKGKYEPRKYGRVREDQPVH